MRWLEGITGSMDMGLSKPREMVKDREVWRAAAHGGAGSRTRLDNNKWDHSNKADVLFQQQVLFHCILHGQGRILDDGEIKPSPLFLWLDRKAILQS